MPVVVLPLAVFGTIVFLAFALTAPSESVIQARLKSYGYQLGNRDLSAPFSERVLLPMVQRLVRLIQRFSPQLVEEETRRRLMQAGNPAGLDASTFVLVKMGGLVILPLLLTGPAIVQGRVDLRTIVLTVVLAFLGWKLPDLWLGSRIRRRQRTIERALPDALDLIVVCVEAGNGLEAALANVTQKLTGPIADEFDRTLREISLGKPRRDALRDLGRRSGVADLQGFCAAILQADQLGVSIAQVLRVQADTMRVRRRQHAEEQAAKVPVKMLFPLIFLIFPALLIVIIGPVGLRLAGFFSTVKPPG